MELYERVDELIKKMGRSRAHLAKQLNIRQTTFNNWFSSGRQHYLWPALLKILEIYPQVSRDWLFFGEGEMRRSGGDEPAVSLNREKELLLKIEQLSGLLVRLENQAGPWAGGGLR
ncbi:MAG: helix-turn-helix domain containing protein [Candidatus Adiutrix sp.]|jgi:transcriptional regulator with XRE-family HTH domain|nr:helix-turn-helix domain containing protein [Candidatus Adiutrix sp.]